MRSAEIERLQARHERAIEAKEAVRVAWVQAKNDNAADRQRVTMRTVNARERDYLDARERERAAWAALPADIKMELATS